jgi:hypothetical protein
MNNKIKKEFIVDVDRGLIVFRTELEISEGELGLDEAYELVDTYLNNKRIEFVDFDLIDITDMERVGVS